MTHDRDYQPAAEGVAGADLLAIIERVESVNEEIKASNEVKKDLFAEAKHKGYDTGAIKEIIKKRAQDPDIRSEREAIVALYENAIGAVS